MSTFRELRAAYFANPADVSLLYVIADVLEEEGIDIETARWLRTCEIVRGRNWTVKTGEPWKVVSRWPDEQTAIGFLKLRISKKLQPIWRTRDGEKLFVEDMPTSHLANCLRMLHRNRRPMNRGIVVELLRRGIYEITIETNRVPLTC